MSDEITGFIHPYAVIGEPPEHRDYRWEYGNSSTRFFKPEIEETAIIEAFVTIDSGIKQHTYVGHKTMVMKHSHIGHDAYVGAYVNVAPGTIIGGHCVIENGAKLGIGSLIRPRTKIGHDAIIGAGAVVVKDVPAGETWAGNPAKAIANERPRHWTPYEEYDAWMEWYDKAFGPR